MSRPSANPPAPGSEAEEAGGNDVDSGGDSGNGGEAAAAGSDLNPESEEEE